MVPKAQDVIAEPSIDGRELALELGGIESSIQVERKGTGALRLRLDGVDYDVQVAPRARQRRDRRSSADEGGEGQLKAPLPGVLLEIRVSKGDEVVQGEVVAVLEAMKMQNEIEAPVAGVVTEILAEQGESLDNDQPILVVEPVGS